MSFTTIIRTQDAAKHNIPAMSNISYTYGQALRIAIKLKDVWDVNTEVADNGKWKDGTLFADAKWKFGVTVATRRSLSRGLTEGKISRPIFWLGAAQGRCNSDLHGGVYAGKTPAEKRHLRSGDTRETRKK